MNQLGINNRGDMMKLGESANGMRHHGKRKPPKERLRSGSPTFDIPKSVLENHIEEGFMIKEIGSISIERRSF